MPYKDPEKEREQQRRWRKQNPEKVREQQRRWRKQNPEKVREKYRRWREKNRDAREAREKERERSRRWREKNREKNREAREAREKEREMRRRWREQNPEKVREMEREKDRERRRRWREQNREKDREKSRRAIGNIPLRPQPAACDICSKVTPKLVSEHCHKTGIWRGWTCVRCNLYLGILDRMRDDPAYAAKLHQYLRDAEELHNLLS